MNDDVFLTVMGHHFKGDSGDGPLVCECGASLTLTPQKGWDFRGERTCPVNAVEKLDRPDHPADDCHTGYPGPAPQVNPKEPCSECLKEREMLRARADKAEATISGVQMALDLPSNTTREDLWKAVALAKDKALRADKAEQESAALREKVKELEWAVDFHKGATEAALAEENALRARVEELQKALEEREAGMHQRIRLGYDKTVADSWRAEVARAVAEERERCAKIAESPYNDEVQAMAGDEPRAVGEKIAAAIRNGGK